MLMLRTAQLCELVCFQGNQQNLVTRRKKEKEVSQSEKMTILGKRDDYWL